MKKLYTLACIFFLIPLVSWAQISVNTSQSDNALIQSLGGQGVTISNVNIAGANGAYGSFSGGNFGISNGVVLTTGSAVQAIGPNDETNAATNTTAGGNALLDGLGQGTTEDATVATFQIVTQGCSLSFDYVFGSEEYHEYVDSQFNDVFGLFISGPGITGNQNLATLPNSNTAVSINNVNNGETDDCNSNGPGTNSNFFVDNCNGNNIQYDGHTSVLTANADGLTPGSVYTITLAVGDVGDGGWDSGVFISAGSFSSVANVAFHFEDEDGNEKDEFCIGQDVFLNGAATANTGSYFMDLWIVESNGDLDWISGVGWQQGSPDLLNITQIFQNDPDHPVVFQEGVTYGVKIAISDPECGWVELIQSFTYVNCCDKFESVDFLLDIDASQGGYALIAKDFEEYDFINAQHEWYVLSSPNETGGPYTPVHSTTTTGTGPVTIFNDADYGLYYTVIHKVITDCGELCYARVQYQVGLHSGGGFSRGGEVGEVDCCLVFEYWPNGVGEPIEFTAKFDIGLSTSGNILTQVGFEYENNPSIVHEWYLYSSPNPTGGPYDFVDSQIDVIDYTYGTIENELYYFLIHKVKSDCGEVCFGQSICRNCPEESKGSCELCGPIDCSIIDDINGECETMEAPTNLQVNGNVLSWDPVPNAVSYIVSSPGAGEPVIVCNCETGISLAPIPTEETFVELGGSLPNKCFIWRVTAICADGSEMPSEQSCFGGNIIGGGGKDKGMLDAHISPNPSNGNMELSFTSSYDTDLEIEVYDFFGRSIQTFSEKMTSFKKKSVQWNANNRLPKGIYFVQFRTNEETIYKQIIIE